MGFHGKRGRHTILKKHIHGKMIGLVIIHPEHTSSIIRGLQVLQDDLIPIRPVPGHIKKV